MKIGGGRGNFLKKVSPSPSKPPPSSSKTFDLIESLFPVFRKVKAGGADRVRNASRRSLGRISVPMWPVALSGRLPVEALVGHHPTNKLIGRDPIPCRKSFPRIPCGHLEHPALPPVSRSYSGAWGRLVTHYSPVRHSHPGASARDPVRLACVKHAASVHPEPESNPPQKNLAKTSER